MTEPGGAGLVRVIRRWELVALAVNGVIGAGIFGLPSEVFRRIGPWSLAAFVACGLVVMLIVLCFAEVSSRYSGTGGPYLYAREAFGPLVGFEVGWLMWVARVTAFAANCNLLISYAGFFFPWAEGPGARAGLTVVVVLLFSALNVLGVRNATIANNLFAVAKLVPLLLFIGAGALVIDPDRFASAPTPPLGEFSASVLVLIYAFSGFEMATVAAGETRHPQRDLPFALLVAMAVVISMYVAIQAVAIGTLPTLATSARPLADAGARVLGGAGGALITAGALVSILGNLNVILTLGTRIPYAMAERGQLPRALAAVHPKFRTPHVAIAGTAAVILVLALSGTFVYVATISVIARLLSYAATCAALPVLRRRPAAPPPHFTAPAGTAACVAALILVAWLLSHVTLAQARDALIAMVAGLLLYRLHGPSTGKGRPT